MGNDGWIKLHRKVLENPIVMKDPEYFVIWIYLLLNASHAERDVLFKGKRITLSPGQLITGRKKIAAETGVNETKVTRVLEVLKSERQIEQQTSSKNRLISVLNWDEYQKSEQQNEQQVNNKWTTTEHKQELKKKKNVKKNKFNEFAQTSYNFEELERQLLKD